MDLPYNFFGIVSKMFDLWHRWSDRCVDNKNIILFTLLMLIGNPLFFGIATPILLTLGVIEWMLYNIFDFVEERSDENMIAMFGVFILFIPILIFFGPGMIWTKIKDGREEQEEKHRRFIIHHIDEEIERIGRRLSIEEKDFIPIKHITRHKFNQKEEPTNIRDGIIGGYYSIAIGMNNVVRNGRGDDEE
jgi:hypothetical protein